MKDFSVSSCIVGASVVGGSVVGGSVVGGSVVGGSIVGGSVVGENSLSVMDFTKKKYNRRTINENPKMKRSLDFFVIRNVDLLFFLVIP